MAQMHSQIPIGHLSLVDMPFAIPELVIFKVPLLMVHSVPQFHAPTGSKILLSASLTPMMILLPPQDPPRPSMPNLIRVLGLLTGVALSNHAFLHKIHATLLRPPRGSSPTGTHLRTRRLRIEAVVRIAAKNVPSKKAPKYLKLIASVPKVPHAELLLLSFVHWYFVQTRIPRLIPLVPFHSKPTTMTAGLFMNARFLSLFPPACLWPTS